MSKIILSNGVEMPFMAIGTNWMEYKKLKEIMKAGFDAGFCAIDTARDYANEATVGKSLHNVLKEKGLKRENIFITTKIGNQQQIQGNIGEQIEISLQNLQTDYIDLWLMHWPYPGHFEKTWKKMIEVYKTGKVRAIGVANYDIRHLNKLLSSEIEIIPMVNQIEYHPLRSTNELICYMRKHSIKIQAYAPLCRLVPALKESIALNKIAQKYNKTLGQIILRWHTQQGDIMPVFKSYNPCRFNENMNILDFSLTEREMEQIFNLNQNYKYHIESINCPGY